MLDLTNKIKDISEEKKHVVKFNNWYFNAGIAGFLNILSDYNEFISIHNDSISFDDEVLEVFIPEVLKKLYNIHFSNTRKRLIGNIIKKDSKIITILNTKFKQSLFLMLVKEDLSLVKTIIKNKIKNPNAGSTVSKNQEEQFNIENNRAKELFKEALEGDISYNYLMETDKELLLKYFKFNYGKVSKLDSKLGFDMLNKYIHNIKEPSNKNKGHCTSCGNYKSDLSIMDNSASQIIGYCKDNRNFTWDLKSTANRICPTCKLIYFSVFASLAYFGKDMYFVHNNTSMENLDNFSKIFLNKFEDLNNNERNMGHAIKNIYNLFYTEKINASLDNMEFIVIKHKSYDPQKQNYNYTIDNYELNREIAQFINNNFHLLGGYFSVGKNDTVSITELLVDMAIKKNITLKTLTIMQKIYNSLDKKTFSMSKVAQFILNYIKKGNKMKDIDNIYKHGRRAGVGIRERLLKDDKENQISGICIDFLKFIGIKNKRKLIELYYKINSPNKTYLSNAVMTNTTKLNLFFHGVIIGLTDGLPTNNNKKTNTNDQGV